jgi:flavin reductase (DIM6/NTAB) family NADH-FMN oxidoreductase RutF
MGKVSISPGRFLLTTPLALLSAWGRGGKPNIVTIAWTGVLCSDPPLVYASVRPARFTHRLLEQNGDFVLNLPATGQAREVDLCGTVSGRKVDKFSLCGLTAVPAGKVDAPAIAECPVHLECRTIQVLSLGVHDAFIAEVLAIRADEAIVRGRGRIDPHFALLVYATSTGSYHRTERIERIGFSRPEEKKH